MKKLISLFMLLLFVSSINAQSSKKEKIDYGKNIVSFIPFYAIANNQFGIGVSYEYLMNDYIGIRVPLMADINHPYFNGGIELKLYPVKNTGVAKYAVAPMIMFGSGKGNIEDYVWDPVNNNYILTTSNYNRTHFGFLLTNSLNFTISKNFYIAMDAGIGMNYFDKTTYTSKPTTTSKTSFLAQFQVLTVFRF